ncbi:MAG: HupE/UreJ family protein [Polyangiaceae bacterium]|nr:HupE/UreJ family protein [Polyangiaceae bacterium]
MAIRPYPLATLAFVIAFSARALAHAIGLSSAEYTAHQSSLVMKATFARSEIASLLPALDANHDGHITAMEVQLAEGGPQGLRRQIVERVIVTGDGAVCPGVLTDAALVDTDGFSVRGRYDCPKRVRTFTVDVSFMNDWPAGHRHVVRAIGKTTHDAVVVKGQTTFTVDAPSAVADDASSSRSASTPARAPIPAARATAFFWMGVDHILTGYDHLLFLFGLVLASTRVRDLLSVVTAFTIGHSLTLALAATGALVPSARFVEPMIALSIAYVGVENLFAPNAAKRWRIALPFGLLHGFGFASALRSIGLDRNSVLLPLVAFNLGVETGQVVVIAALTALVFVTKKRPWFGERGMRLLSVVVAVVGAAWFFTRLV